MSLLKITFLLAWLSFPTKQPAPIDAWLDSPSTTSLDATYSKKEATIEFNLAFRQDFSGEVVILSNTGESVYQNYHDFSPGEHHLRLDAGRHIDGDQLAVFHDFNTHFLKTIKLTFAQNATD